MVVGFEFGNGVREEEVDRGVLGVVWGRVVGVIFFGVLSIIEEGRVKW